MVVLEGQSAEEHVRVVLSGWKSQYCYTLTPLLLASTAASSAPSRFSVEWSRRPSPHEPLPSIRVHMTVTVSADGELTCRLEGEQAVHRASLDGGGSMDAHLLRLLKAKAEFLKRNRLPLSAPLAACLSSRLQYAAYTPPPLTALATHGHTQLALVVQLDRKRHVRQPTGHSLTTHRQQQQQQQQQHTTRKGWDEEDDERGQQQQQEQEQEEREQTSDGAEQQDGADGLEGLAAGRGLQAAIALYCEGDVSSQSQSELSTREDATSGSLESAVAGPARSISAESAPSSAYTLPSAAALEGRLVELFRQADVDGRYALHDRLLCAHSLHSSLDTTDVLLAVLCCSLCCAAVPRRLPAAD